VPVAVRYRGVVSDFERTLVICKPDAVERRLVGEIVGRMEAKGLTLVAAELRTIDSVSAGGHYGEHEGKGFYESLIAFITSGPALVMVVEGPEGTTAMVRSMIGTTDPAKAAPGTIRGDFATEARQNLVHASDSEEAAAREIGLFFPGL
jgi:nucleoside-diphosphate kinase